MFFHLIDFYFKGFALTIINNNYDKDKRFIFFFLIKFLLSKLNIIILYPSFNPFWVRQLADYFES
jgi:hypothetical protein